MTKYYDLITEWKKIFNYLANGQSVILHAPRFYKKRRTSRLLLNDIVQRGNNRIVITIDANSFLIDNSIDYNLLWNYIAEAICSKIERDVNSSAEFKYSLMNYLKRSKKKIFIIIECGGHKRQLAPFKIISDFHFVFTQIKPEDREKIVLFALDDYSLYYYEKHICEEVSLWDYFERVHIQNISLTDIETLVEYRFEQEYDSKEQKQIEESIYSVTGGHVGLVIEILDSFDIKQKKIPIKKIIKSIQENTIKSFILEKIRKILSESPIHLIQLALQYEKPKYTIDHNNSAIQFLRELGVIQANYQGLFVLCAGAIAYCIQNIKREGSNPTALGELVQESGFNLYHFNDEDKIFDKNDIILLHISDLHIGEKFPYYLPNTPKKEEQPKLEKFISRDLKRLNLIGRIDKLIISGDISEYGIMDEFIRAIDFLEVLTHEINIPKENIFVVPGNHDVEWEPSVIKRSNPITGASTESYNTFHRLLKYNLKSDFNIESVVTKTNSQSLVFVLLNSNYIEGKEYAGLGYISRKTLENVDDRIAEIKKELTNRNIPQINTWIILHHHVFPATSLSYRDAINKKMSLLANSAELLEFAAKWDVQAILHGHEHQPAITSAFRWPFDLDPNYKKILSIGAGSISASRDELGPFSRNHYFILYKKTDKIIIRSRAIGGTGTDFVAHGDVIYNT